MENHGPTWAGYWVYFHFKTPPPPRQVIRLDDISPKRRVASAREEILNLAYYHGNKAGLIPLQKC